MLRRFRRAFTLIELLVVIAIIAILAAILFPVFASAQESARKASCQSNMKQILTAFAQYTSDFDERYPPAERGHRPCPGGNNSWHCVPANGNTTWAARLQPYTKNEGIFVCPSGTDGARNAWTGARTSGWNQYRGDPRTRPISYYMNGFFAKPVQIPGTPFSTGGWTRALGIAEAELDAPADRALLGETGRYRLAADVHPWVLGGNPDFGDRRRATQWFDWYAVHQEGTNIAFADGHVKFYHDSRTAPGGYATQAAQRTLGPPYGNMTVNPPIKGWFYFDVR